MKIGIITVHDSANFGSFLQAYALQNILLKMNHEVYFIRTRDEDYLRNLYYSNKITKKTLRHPISSIREKKWGKQKYKTFTKEQECFITIDKPDDMQLDLVIIGSDELWNVCTPVFQKPIFYGEAINVPKITYAMSVGKSTYEQISKYSNLVELIRKIDEITVRDENTRMITQKICGIEPKMVCDPTLLVDSSIFKKEYHNPYLVKNKYLLVYSYNISKELKENLISFAHKNNLKLVSACFYFSWCDYNFVCSPLDFCSVLKNAEYVVTTTFHGSIFSFLNHKNFVSIPQSPKVNDILGKVGLEDVIFSGKETSQQIEEHFKNHKIDYSAVDKKIKSMRDESLDILKGMIERNGNNM